MKSTTPQPVFAQTSHDSGGAFAVGSLAFSSKEQARSPLVQLILRDQAGQVVECWPISQTKCTIGSADTCNVRCSLSGIEPINAIVIQGARQAFIRALVPNLSQDGVATRELLLTEQKNYFELAGHRFELHKKTKSSLSPAPQQSRLRFTSARPFNLGRPLANERYATPGDQQSPTELADAPWLKGLIERTIEPIEAQIASLLMPVAEYQTQMLQAQQLQKSQSVQEQQRQAELAREISSIVAKQSATMESLGERLRDVNQQLATIERIIEEDNDLESRAKDGITQEVSVQRVAVEQLQAGMVAVTESLNQLHDRQHSAHIEQQTWKDGLQQQLDSLSQVVADIKERTSHRADSEILSAVQSLQQSHQLAQEEVQRWQYGLHDQLETLEKRIAELPTLQQSMAISISPPEQATVQPICQASEAMSSEAEASIGTQETASEPSAIQSDWLDQWTTIQPSLGTSSLGTSSPDQQFHEELNAELVGNARLSEYEEALSNLKPSRNLSHDVGHVVAEEESNATSQPFMQPEAPDTSEFVWSDDALPTESDHSYAPTIVKDDSTAWNDEPDLTFKQSESTHQELNLLQWNQPEEAWVDQPVDDNIESNQQLSQNDGETADSSGHDQEWDQIEFPTTGSTLAEPPDSLPSQSATTNQPSDDEGDFFFGSSSVASHSGSLRSLESPISGGDALPVVSSRDTESEVATQGDKAGMTALPSWWNDDDFNEPQVLDSHVSESTDSNVLPESSNVLPESSNVLPESDALPDELLNTREAPNWISVEEAPIASQPIEVEPTSQHQEEASVEQYMRDLLSRMRGDSSSSHGNSTEKETPSSRNLPAVIGQANQNQVESQSEPEPAEPEEMIDPDTYISLTNAPEKSKNIHAMRDLANNSARHAIHKSTRQRYISTSLLKLAICMIALTVSGVLFAINGFVLNIGLVATFASLLVAAIWGYDAITGLKPLLHSTLVLAPPDTASTADSEDKQ